MQSSDKVCHCLKPRLFLDNAQLWSILNVVHLDFMKEVKEVPRMHQGGVAEQWFVITKKPVRTIIYFTHYRTANPITWHCTDIDVLDIGWARM